MVLTSAELGELICGVWAPSLDLAVAPAAPGDGDGWSHAAALRFLGAWDGQVVIDASDGFARAVAAAMFGLPAGQVSPDDERDALGEMANVLGGSVKSYADGEVDLDLPVTGDPGVFTCDDAEVVAAAWCAIGASPVRVQVCRTV